MKTNIIQEIINNKIIVIVRGIDKAKLINVAQSLHDGGIRFLEITYSANGAIKDEETAANIKMLCDYFDGKMVIGAGTVLTEEQVELTMSAGGKFIISPDTNPSVIKKTNELGMVSIPGALTPTEIQQAYRAGADFVKMFPITIMGVDYVKALKAPLSHIRLLAVGGITIDNMNDYINAGVYGFGIGSNIIDKNLINENNRITTILFEKRRVVVLLIVYVQNVNIM